MAPYERRILSIPIPIPYTHPLRIAIATPHSIRILTALVRRVALVSLTHHFAG